MKKPANRRRHGNKRVSDCNNNNWNSLHTITGTLLARTTKQSNSLAGSLFAIHWDKLNSDCRSIDGQPGDNTSLH
jgi:hypothetical protein